jgi:hypothetical protein
MLNGRELVNGPDFKPLVLRHSEDSCKPNPGAASRQSAVAATPVIENIGDTVQTQPAAVGTEVSRVANTRAWHPMSLQPAVSSEVVQFRRLQYRELTPEDYELLCLLDDSLPKKNITPPGIVRDLPRILARDCNATECHVCLSRLEPYMYVVPLPCGHAFHPECVSRWLTQCKGSCPLCMTPVDLVVDSTSKQSHGQIRGQIADASQARRQVAITSQAK